MGGGYTVSFSLVGAIVFCLVVGCLVYLCCNPCAPTVIVEEPSSAYVPPYVAPCVVVEEDMGLAEAAMVGAAVGLADVAVDAALGGGCGGGVVVEAGGCGGATAGDGDGDGDGGGDW